MGKRKEGEEGGKGKRRRRGKGGKKKERKEDKAGEKERKKGRRNSKDKLYRRLRVGIIISSCAYMQVCSYIKPQH